MKSSEKKTRVCPKTYNLAETQGIKQQINKLLMLPGKKGHGSTGRERKREDDEKPKE